MTLRSFICGLLKCSQECEAKNAKLLEVISILRDKFDELRAQYERMHLELEECRQKISPIPAPKITGEIELEELYSLLKGKFPDARIYLSDRKYNLATKSEIQRFLERDETDKYKYQVTYFDCDNYSYRLMGNASIPEWASLAFGICWTVTHAFNIFVGSDKKVYLIEPQSDKVYEFDKAPLQYKKLRLIVM